MIKKIQYNSNNKNRIITKDIKNSSNGATCWRYLGLQFFSLSIYIRANTSAQGEALMALDILLVTSISSFSSRWPFASVKNSDANSENIKRNIIIDLVIS